MSEPQLIPIPEAARRVGVGRTKAYELVAAGELEAVHIGKRHLVVAESVDTYIERLRAAA